ncbi:MAG: hypothetical protein ACNA8L_05105 [Luteolibacter sp.]
MKPGPHLPPPPITYRMMQVVMCPILKALGLCCRSAFNLCNEQMDRELTKGESFRLRTHLMMCGLCRRLPAQFDGMRKLIQATCEHEHEHEHDCCSESLSKEAKERIAKQLETYDKA